MAELFYNNPYAQAGAQQSVRTFLEEQAGWIEQYAATLPGATFVREPECLAAQLQWEGTLARPHGEVRRSLMVGVHAGATACKQEGRLHAPDRLAWMEIVDRAGEAGLTLAFTLERDSTGLVHRAREAEGSVQRDNPGKPYEECSFSPIYGGTLRNATDLHSELKTMRTIVTSGQPAGVLMQLHVVQRAVSRMPRALFK